MTKEKFQGKYRIASARYPHHDYNNGLYFITICTKHRENYFGDVAFNGTLLHSEIGKWAVENLQQIKNHYPYCDIPVFVVMPNHIHAIVAIDDGNGDADRRYAARHVSTSDVPKTKQQIAENRGLLSVVIGGFKSAITRYANQNNIPFKWQERFHDRIIRNQDECNRIAEYIENNPYQWALDEFYNE